MMSSFFISLLLVEQVTIVTAIFLLKYPLWDKILEILRHGIKRKSTHVNTRPTYLSNLCEERGSVFGKAWF